MTAHLRAMRLNDNTRDPLRDLFGTDLAWVTLDARCTGIGGDTFFPDPGSRSSAAKKVCRTCPLQAPCLEYALANRTEGVWGGTSEDDRRILLGLAPKTKPTTAKPRDLKPCGTRAAYRRHAAKDEPPCDACRRANSAAVAATKKRAS